MGQVDIPQLLMGTPGTRGSGVACSGQMLHGELEEVVESCKFFLRSQSVLAFHTCVTRGCLVLVQEKAGTSISRATYNKDTVLSLPSPHPHLEKVLTQGQTRRPPPHCRVRLRSSFKTCEMLDMNARGIIIPNLFT